MRTVLSTIFINTLISSSIFVYLINKTKIKKRFIYTDNVVIILVSTLFGVTLTNALLVHNVVIIMLLNLLLTIMFIVLLTLFRFYRDPERNHIATELDILSPADGFIIYIKKIGKNETPFAVKGKTVAKLSELSKVDILQSPCWLVGIVMTMFDVHVNRAPVAGEVVLNQYFKGNFLSLKKGESDILNERNTMVIKNDNGIVGVVQIASKRVRGIETYVRDGQYVEMGERIGKIKFGSQVDIIFPSDAQLTIKCGQWVYAGKTIIATLKAGTKIV